MRQIVVENSPTDDYWCAPMRVLGYYGLLVSARARVCMLSRVLIVLQPYIGFTMHSDEAFDDEVAL